jgi:predicted amidohydrolase
VFDTALCKIGPIICADLQFPESIRCLALDGAEIIINSTAWSMRGNEPTDDYSGFMYELLTTANALMNQVWIVQADQIGKALRSSLYCYGHSRIIDPMGRIVADTKYNEGLAIATVNIKGELTRARTSEFVGKDLLENRRPEAYTAIYRTAPEAIQP